MICDVSDAASAEAAIAKAAAAHGPARVLVNCAGIGVAKRVIGKEGPMALGDFEKVIKVNLIGSFNMLRLATAGMSKLEPLATGERGVVISTASVAAYDGQIGQSAYSASKGGIVAMTLPIARELAQFGIRVLTIAPGLFLTPLLANLPQEAQDSLAASIPFRAGSVSRRVCVIGAAHDRQPLFERRSGAARCRASHGAALGYCKSCSSTGATCRSSGAIATPPTSFTTRDISRCSTIDLDHVRSGRFSKQDIIHKYGLVGIPMVDTRAKFHIPSTHGDWIRIESRIESFKRSSFEVVHNVFKGEALAIEAFETRVLVGKHPDDPAS